MIQREKMLVLAGGERASALHSTWIGGLLWLNGTSLRGNFSNMANSYRDRLLRSGSSANSC